MNFLSTFLFMLLLLPCPGGAQQGINKATSLWKQRGGDIIGSRNGTEAGASVAISADGLTLSFAEYGDSNGPYIVNNTGTGRIRVVRYNEENEEWIDGEVLTNGLIQMMEISGDGTTIAEVRFDYRENVEQYTVAEVFKLNESSSEWMQLGQNFTADNLGSFALTQSFSRDGKTLVLALATGQQAPIINFRVYRFNSEQSMWQKQGEDIDVKNTDLFVSALSADGTTLATLTNREKNMSMILQVYDISTDDFEQIGRDVEIPSYFWHVLAQISISDNGNVVAVGAPQYEAGDDSFISVYELKSCVDGENSVNAWSQRAHLTGKGYFGYAIDLSATGDTLAAGDPTHYSDRVGGSLQVFRFDGFNYVRIGGILEGPAGSSLGISVAISSEGNVVAAGGISYRDSTGIVRVYELREEAMTEDEFRSATSNAISARSAELSKISPCEGLSSPSSGAKKEYLWLLLGLSVFAQAARLAFW